MFEGKNRERKCLEEMKMLSADVVRKRRRHVTQKAPCQHISCRGGTLSITMAAQFLPVSCQPGGHMKRSHFTSSLSFTFTSSTHWHCQSSCSCDEQENNWNPTAVAAHAHGPLHLSRWSLYEAESWPCDECIKGSIKYAKYEIRSHSLTVWGAFIFSFADHMQELSCRGANTLRQQTQFSDYWRTASPTLVTCHHTSCSFKRH